MYLETERLILRQMDMGDIGDLAEMLEDQKVMYAYDHTFGDDETEKWLKRQMERYQKYGFGLLLSVRKPTAGGGGGLPYPCSPMAGARFWR